MIHEILKMGDPRLLRIAPPVPPAMLGSAELDMLIKDMFETMRAAHYAKFEIIPALQKLPLYNRVRDSVLQLRADS